MPSLWARIRQSRYRWVFRLAVVLVAGIGLLAWAAWGQGRGALAIENQSGVPVALLKVTVGGQTTTFHDLRPGARVAAPVGPDDSNHYAVEVRLADGTIIHGGGEVPEGSSLVVLPGGRTTFRKAAR